MARHSRRPLDDLFGYHYIAGYPQLKESIAAYLGVARGVDVSPDQIIVTTGAQAALDLIARLLLDEGDTVWMEEPGYPGAQSAFLAAGARLEPLPVEPHRGWRLSETTPANPKLIYVTPSCQYPLGNIMPIEQRLQLTHIAEQRGLWIVEDDYDSEYRYRNDPAPALYGLNESEHVIYVGTFAKTLFPALRLGYMVVPGKLAEKVKHALNITGQFAPLLLQATVDEFMRGGHYSRHLKRMRQLYAKRQKHFVGLCRQHLQPWLEVGEHHAGLQIVARFRHGVNDREISDAALAHGINVTALSTHFRHSGAHHGLLMGYAAVDDEAMEAGVQTLRRVLQTTHPSRTDVTAQLDLPNCSRRPLSSAADAA